MVSRCCQRKKKLPTIIINTPQTTSLSKQSGPDSSNAEKDNPGLVRILISVLYLFSEFFLSFQIWVWMSWQTNQNISSGKDFWTRKLILLFNLTAFRTTRPIASSRRSVGWGVAPKTGSEKIGERRGDTTELPGPGQQKPNIAGNSTPTRAVGRHHLLLPAYPTYVLDLPWKLFWCL